MRQVAFPFDIDAGGQTADADAGRHLRGLIEQILFTTPGERVMRPDFGAGIAALVFAPAGDAMAAAIETQAHAALQGALGGRARILGVGVSAGDGRLTVEVRYRAGTAEQTITVEGRP